MPFSWSNFRKFSKIFTVAMTSPMALWALSFVTLKCWHRASRRLLGRWAINLLANFLVHKVWFSMGVSRWAIPLWLRNPWSKVALWATNMWSPKNSRKLGNAWSMVGASFTMVLVIPVRWVMKEGIGVSGFMSVWYVFSIFLPSNCTAAISVMWCLSLLSHVVSISTIM